MVTVGEESSVQWLYAPDGMPIGSREGDTNYVFLFDNYFDFVPGEDGVLKVDPSACNGCGRCKGKCPFGVTEEYTNGYRIYIGGRWGKKIANGRPLGKLFLREEEVLDTVERAILFFRDEGITGERFADTINRLGFDYVEDKLLHGDVDKSAILEKNVTGGATC